MKKKIILSKRASRRLGRLLDYLESEWNVKVKNEFIIKLDRSLSQIQNFPKSFQKSKEIKGLHKCVVSRQTSLFYKVEKERIIIVAIFDNRMDPARLKNEIE